MSREFIFVKLRTLSIVFFSLILFGVAHASNLKIVIKITMGECLTCYGEPHTTNTLLQKAEKIDLVFKNYPVNAIKNYLRIQYPVDLKKVNIIPSDSLYNKYNKNYLSEVFILKNNKVIYSCLIKELPQNIPYINFLFSGIPAELKLPPEANILFASKIYFNDSLFYIFDPFQSSVFCVNKQGKLIQTINGDFLNFDTLFLKTVGNKEKLKLFYRYKPFLSKIGKDILRIHSVFFSGKNLFMYVVVPYVDVKKGDSVTVNILGKEAILRFKNVRSKNYDVFLGDNHLLDSNYYQAPFEGFFTDPENGNLKIPVIKQKQDTTKNYFLATYLLKNNHYVFDSFDTLTLPEFFVKNKVYYQFMSPIIAHGVYFNLNSSNVLYNFKNGYRIETPFKNTSFIGDSTQGMLQPNNYFLDDFIIDKTSVQYVYFDNNKNKYFLNKSDLIKSNNRTLEIDLSEYPKILSNISFYNEKVIFFISSDNTIVFKKLPDF